jgi:CRISPR-associated protein Csb2
MACFAVSMRLLDCVFRGRRDGGEPEWPPSPMRAFQALVAAAAARERPAISEETTAALRWLEQLEPPIIRAPRGSAGLGYVVSVPNNTMDVVARAWARGGESESGDANPATHRTMKSVRAVLVSGEAVHYLWPIREGESAQAAGYAERLRLAARSVMALGWGIDLAVGDATVLSAEAVRALPGDEWHPQAQGGSAGLRVPSKGALDDLRRRHERFLHRLSARGFTAPPPLGSYRMIGYRRAIDRPAPPFVAFSLLTLDAMRFRPFDAARRGLTVAGMMRHATRRGAEASGWSEEQINGLVLGHQDPERVVSDSFARRRFLYLPLPSVQPRGEHVVIGQVRRVLLTASAGDMFAEISWARRALSGQELMDEATGELVTLLALMPASDPVVACYTKPTAAWATVTPVVLPGYDDPRQLRRRLDAGVSAEEQRRLLDQLHRRVDRLLRKAIVQAGFGEALAGGAELEWSLTGFWPGVDHVSKYGMPDHLAHLPRLHVRLTWRNENGTPIRVPGPICLGGGRYYGVGLFARRSDEGRAIV